MKVTIENNEVVIRLPLQKPTLSKSGKSHIIAGTGGFAKAGVVHEGKEVSVAVNVIIK